MNAIKEIEQKIHRLPPDLIKELDRFLDYLLNKEKSTEPKKLKLDWAGELKNTKSSALELQKKALDWRKR